MEEIIKNICRRARLLGACSLLTGEVRTLEKLARLFLSPQGIEFCLDRGFPDLETFRELKPYGLDRFGIYVDAGEISLDGPDRAVLIGLTTASVKCRALKRHEIIMMHGSKAAVEASGWAVCKITAAKGCEVSCDVSENAIML